MKLCATEGRLTECFRGAGVFRERAGVLAFDRPYGLPSSLNVRRRPLSGGTWAVSVCVLMLLSLFLSLNSSTGRKVWAPLQRWGWAWGAA